MHRMLPNNTNIANPLAGRLHKSDPIAGLALPCLLSYASDLLVDYGGSKNVAAASAARENDPLPLEPVHEPLHGFHSGGPVIAARVA